MSAPANQSQSKIVRWIDHRLPVFTFMQHELYDYPTPRNLSYWWNFGSLSGIMLVIMIVTGIFLAMQYTPNATMAFDSTSSAASITAPTKSRASCCGCWASSSCC
jgi:ubiquinol-cytochrome c reductase cytochrome b/c1 subunit